jgi:ketosteroid isomerase-like protein
MPDTETRKHQDIAAALHEAIERGVEIQDLSVAVSGDLAILTGVARTRADRERAASVVRDHAAIREVHNGIVVPARPWWQRLLGLHR